MSHMWKVGLMAYAFHNTLLNRDIGSRQQFAGSHNGARRRLQVVLGLQLVIECG